MGRDFILLETNSSLYFEDKELAALPQTLPTLQPVALGTGG